MVEHLMLGLHMAITPTNLLLIAFGVALGVFVGAMPGLSSTTGLAIVLPFTFIMSPIPAFLMMISLYMAAEYGGSITAIAIGVPGTPPAVPTTFDGYPLTKKGQSGKALGVSIVSSTLGGIFGTVILVIACGPISTFALRFGPAEYFALGVFGLSIVGNLVEGSVLKGFISVIIGLLCCVVGVDILSGYPRFTFGTIGLLDGIHLVPALIGFFAISEVFKLIEESGVIQRVEAEISGKLPTLKELKGLTVNLLRSSAIGAIVGSVPGAGATIASLIAYNEAKRASKTPEKFGTGVIEGVCAPEAANNASVGGAMIPLITLGIPGSGSTAILLGGFMLHGMNPGPLLMTDSPELIYTIYVGFFIAEFFMLAIGLFGIPLWVRLISLRSSTLTPLILGVSLIGSYALGNSTFDVIMAVFFGALGYIMRRFGFPLAPAVLAIVLGFIIEANYRRALSITGGDHMIFLTNPISLVLLLLALATFVIPAVRSYRRKRRKTLQRTP
ncbi:MAG: tripartite tricarboxylate transporter permease [Deltaproteobacteria bacterium]|nr:tripartite tricarboxylate transporter permease [Deltaproteobacteria bacterium]